MGCDSSKQDYPTKILHSPESWKTNGILEIVCETILESQDKINRGSLNINPQQANYIRLILNKKTGRCWEVLINQGAEENYLHNGPCIRRQNEFQFFKMTMDNTFYLIMQRSALTQASLGKQKKDKQFGIISLEGKNEKEQLQRYLKMKTATQRVQELTKQIQLSEANKKHAELYAKKAEEKANQRKKQ